MVKTRGAGKRKKDSRKEEPEKNKVKEIVRKVKSRTAGGGGKEASSTAEQKNLTVVEEEKEFVVEEEIETAVEKEKEMAVEENPTAEKENETATEGSKVAEENAKAVEEEPKKEGEAGGEEDKTTSEETAEETAKATVEERRQAASNDELRESQLEAIKPSRMFFPPSQYKKQIKIGTRCNITEAIKTLDNLKLKLSNTERKWFEEHPQLKHLFHFAEIEKNHKVQGMWMLLLRTAQTMKEKTAWFVVDGVVIRYALREHTLISGLDCHTYPLKYHKKGGRTRCGDRHFKENEPRRLDYTRIFH